ncbi:MAG: hypothetical protein SYC29_16700 [Planctomycetota bacterium]|jgi:hypothetical protein|nr:hypothetical protein [Planctomycetota bacterium]
MIDPALTALSQFGAAGLIGLLWILERRHAAKRDHQLDEAHRMILAQQRERTSLLAVIKENTQAIIRLEESQRQLITLLSRLGRRGSSSAA